MGQGASEERARSRPNPFGEGRATGQLLMGSRVITIVNSKDGDDMETVTLC